MNPKYNRVSGVALEILQRHLGEDGLVAFRWGKPHTGLYALVEFRSTLFPVAGRVHAYSRRSLIGRAVAATAINRIALARQCFQGHITSPDELRRRVNCRPAFAEVRQGGDFCNHEDACIHCWARRAVEVWRGVDAALFPGEGRDRPGVAEHDLVLASRSFDRVALEPYRGEKSIDLAAVFRDRCSDRLVRDRPIPPRGFEMKRLMSAGALDVTVAAPSWRGRPYGWKVEVRQVFAVPPGRPLEVPGARIRRIGSPDRRAAAKAVAWLWRYPRNFLRSADPGRPPESVWIAKYEAAREGRRLFARYGIFRPRRRPSPLEPAG